MPGCTRDRIFSGLRARQRSLTALLFQQRDQPTADVAAAAGEQDQGPVFVFHVRHRSSSHGKIFLLCIQCLGGSVRTKKDEWIEIKLSLDTYQATSFGRPFEVPGQWKTAWAPWADKTEPCNLATLVLPSGYGSAWEVADCPIRGVQS